MTLITLYYKDADEHVKSDRLVCLADSFASNIKNPQCPITQQTIKIVSLNCTYITGYEFPGYPKLHSNEIGIAFAGNISIALQTYNIAQIACKNLQPTKHSTQNGCPSIKSVAVMLSQILKHYYKQYGAIMEESANTELLVFGFCNKHCKFVAYHIQTAIVGNVATTKLNEIDIINDKSFSIGLGAIEFNKYNEINESKQNDIKTNFINFIKTDIAREKGVGGYIQKCIVFKDILYHCADIDKEHFDLSDHQLGGFTFSSCFLDEYMVSIPMHPW